MVIDKITLMTMQPLAVARASSIRGYLWQAAAQSQGDVPGRIAHCSLGFGSRHASDQPWSRPRAATRLGLAVTNGHTRRDLPRASKGPSGVP